MKTALKTSNPVRLATDCLVIAVGAKSKLSEEANEIDKASGILADDGHALFLTGKGEIVLAQVLTEKLEILCRAQVLGGKSYIQPVLAHRRLLCRNNDGSAVCLDLR